MNSVNLVGNLCKDAEVRYTTGENATAMYRNTIAVQRKFKDKNTGKYESDFIPIQAFGNTAEFLGKYFVKGSKVGITGRIQTGSYTNKEGQKVYTTDVIVENAEFVGKREDNPAPAEAPKDKDDFIDIPEGLENELPF